MNKNNNLYKSTLDKCQEIGPTFYKLKDIYKIIQPYKNKNLDQKTLSRFSKYADIITPLYEYYVQMSYARSSLVNPFSLEKPGDEKLRACLEIYQYLHAFFHLYPWAKQIAVGSGDAPGSVPGFSKEIDNEEIVVQKSMKKKKKTKNVPNVDPYMLDALNEIRAKKKGTHMNDETNNQMEEMLQEGGSKKSKKKSKEIYTEYYPPGVDPYMLDALYESRFSESPPTSSDKKYKNFLEFNEGVDKQEALELRFEEDYENNQEVYHNDPLYQKMLTNNPNPDERIFDIRNAKRIIFAERAGRIPTGLSELERARQALGVYDKEFINTIYHTLKVGYQNFVMIVDTLAPFKGKKLNELTLEEQTYLSKYKGVGQQLDSAVTAYNRILNAPDEFHETLKKYVTPEQRGLVKLANKALSPQEYGFLIGIGEGSIDDKTGGAPLNPLHGDDLEYKITGLPEPDPNFERIRRLVKESAAGMFYFHETIRPDRPLNKEKTIEQIRAHIIFLIAEWTAKHPERGYGMKEVQDVVKKFMNKLFDQYDPRKLKFEEAIREYILEAVDEAASLKPLKKKDIEIILKKREEEANKNMDKLRKLLAEDKKKAVQKKKEVVEAAGGPPVSENDNSSDESERGSISDISSSGYYTPRASISGVVGETNPDDLVNETRNVPKESFGKKLCSKLNPLNCVRSSKKNRSDLEENLLGGRKTRKNRKNRKNKKGGFDPDKGITPSIPPKRDRDEDASRNEKVTYYYNLLLLVDSIIPNTYLQMRARRPFNREAYGRILRQIKRYTDEFLDIKTQELHDLLRSNHPLLPNLPAGHEELSFEDRMGVINDFHRQVPGGPVEGHHGGVLGKKKKKTKKIVKRKKNKRRKTQKKRTK